MSDPRVGHGTGLVRTPASIATPARTVAAAGVAEEPDVAAPGEPDQTFRAAGVRPKLGRRLGAGQISLSEARRLALAAQGFAEPRPTGRLDRRHLRRVLDRVGLVQIDSVNVVERAHELTLYSRLGPHPRGRLAEATHRGELFEYWGHEASFIPVAHQPLFRHKMAAAEAGKAWSGLVRLAEAEPGFIQDVLDEVAGRGPVGAGQLLTGSGTGRKGPWWGWSGTKMALEWLFWCGRLAARRRPSFEREYGLPDWFLPADVLAAPTPPEVDQRRELLVLAARSLGVGTAADLADYYRLNLVKARPLLADLVEDGRLQQISVEGWKDPAYLAPGARLPRKVNARALLSPFDPLVWFRPRAERLFDFHYRLEIYTPAAKRRYGYYVLPFLLGDRLVARVDLKTDRAARTLRVLGAWAEPSCDPTEIAPHLAAELTELARFVGADSVTVGDRGDLVASLRPALG
ncbi:MAG: winged helix-turn-helix domain-containing protein [Acidimicrobiales bacterium]